MLTVEAKDHSPPSLQPEGGKLTECRQGFVCGGRWIVLCKGFGRAGIGISDVGSSEYSKRLIVTRRSLTLTSGGCGIWLLSSGPVKLMLAFPLVTSSLLWAHGLDVEFGRHGCLTPERLPHGLSMVWIVQRTIQDASKKEPMHPPSCL